MYRISKSQYLKGVQCPKALWLYRHRPDLKPEDLMQPGEIAEIVMFLLTHHGNAVIDSVNVRRASSAPWF